LDAQSLTLTPYDYMGQLAQKLFQFETDGTRNARGLFSDARASLDFARLRDMADLQTPSCRLRQSEQNVPDCCASWEGLQTLISMTAVMRPGRHACKALVECAP
jgi:hypothetical protein